MHKLFQPSRDATGAAIAIFTAHLHLPQNTTHQTTLQVSILLILIFLIQQNKIFIKFRAH